MIRVKEAVLEADYDYHLGPAPHIVVPPPGPNARDALERDDRLTPTAHIRPYPLVIRRARGSVVEDVDGNRYLDFSAGVAGCSVGHCHPKVVEAVREQADKLMHVCSGESCCEPQINLRERLENISPIPSPVRVYLGNSGAEAVETAMKLARWRTGRKWFLAFSGAFHGRTMGALSLTSSKARQREHFGPLVPMIVHAPYGSTQFIKEEMFEQHVTPDELAAIFVEPVLGEGGYVFPPADFLPALRTLCDEHGILLVADEIQCGMGRTGKWWAVQHAGVIPDVLLLASGLADGMPVSAVVARGEAERWPPAARGSSFGGNPVSCAAALATIELLEQHYLENAANLESVALEKLRAATQTHACIDNPRARGLMCACDVVTRRSAKRAAELRDRIVREAFQRGLILLGCGESSIRFVPPLCIHQTQLEVGFDVLDEAVATVETL